MCVKVPNSRLRAKRWLSPGLGMLTVESILMVGLFPVWALASDGIEPIGVSTQARARGGADVAVGDSALSQIDNPATLTLSPGQTRFEMAGELGIVDLRWRGLVDSTRSESRVIPLLNSGLSVPITDRLTLGGAIHSKSGLLTRYNARHLLIPFTQRRVGSDLKVISLPVSAGYKLTDRLSLGLGARLEVASAKFSTVLGPADVEFGRGYAYGAGFQAGVHYKPIDTVALGLGYRSPTWFNDLHGGRAKACLLGVLPVPLGSAAIDELRLPQKLTLGAAWDATPWLKLVGEARWINYANSSLRSAVIAAGGVIDLRYPLPLGYRDQWAFILGSEIKLSEHWTLGTGYHFATEAVSASNLLPQGSVINQHHASIGMTYKRNNWWAGGGYIVGFPASLKGSGRSDILLGVDYGRSSLRQTQHGIFFGFGMSWDQPPSKTEGPNVDLL